MTVLLILWPYAVQYVAINTDGYSGYELLMNSNTLISYYVLIEFNMDFFTRMLQ